MEKIKSLNNYQKAILIAMTAMALIFAVIYAKTISRVGYQYRDEILVQTQENGTTVYSGKIQGEQTQFIVSEENNSVLLQYGDKTYGPYTVKEDPTAIPPIEMADQMSGIEIREGDQLLFRGGVFDAGDSYWLYNEDTTLDNFGMFAVTGDGVKLDANGNVIDWIKPSASVIYELLNTPDLKHKGDIMCWFAAVFVCILNALSMLFADGLFRWSLLFRIRNVENAEPSDWEMSSRYVSWTVVTMMALVIFIIGLA